MTKTVKAVGFELEQKQSDMIEKKLKRVDYADDLIIDLIAQVKHDKQYAFDITTNFRWGAQAHVAAEDFDFAANVTGETIAIAAEGQKAGTEAYSNVVVFSSKAMLLSGELSYASFNNAAYFMNMLNTITEKEDNTVVIEGKSLENATLGAPGAETSNAVMIVFMIVLPALILILGIVLWIRRRNR